MEIIFLGTGQRERIPLLYHKDPICTEARKPGSKENRTQSSIAISENNTFLLFDCTEHFLEQAEKGKINLNNLTAVFATDAHEESIGGLGFLDKCLGKKVQFYSSVKVVERVKERFKNLKNIESKAIENEKTLKIDKISITPLEIPSSIQKGHSVLAYLVGDEKTKIVYSKNSADIPEDKKHYYKENDCLIIGAVCLKTDWLVSLGNKITIFTWIGHGDGTLLHKDLERQWSGLMGENKEHT